MKKKKIIAGIVVVIIAIIGIFLIKMQMDNQEQKNKEGLMESITKTYYEDYLYDMLAIGKSQDELNEFFSQYKKDGLKVSIENMSKVSEIDVKKDMKELKNSCNKKKDNVTILPREPYGKKDYTIKAVCE